MPLQGGADRTRREPEALGDLAVGDPLAHAAGTAASTAESTARRTGGRAGLSPTPVACRQSRTVLGAIPNRAATSSVERPFAYNATVSRSTSGSSRRVSDRA